MSRIGRMPVTIPAGVEVSIVEPNVVTVKGPKGTLTQTMRPEMIIKVEDGVIHVGRPSEDKLHKKKLEAAGVTFEPMASRRSSTSTVSATEPARKAASSS